MEAELREGMETPQASLDLLTCACTLGLLHAGVYSCVCIRVLKALCPASACVCCL